MKIVTFTPNPAIDLYALTTGKISPNEIAKTTKEEYFPGGKGINISRVLLSFGFQTTSLFCPAGFNGQKLANLCREFNIPFSARNIHGETRTNIIFEDTEKNRYKFNFMPPNSENCTTEEQLQIAEWLIPHCIKNDILYIGGSLLNGMDSYFYEYISENIKEKNIKLALDVSSKNIKEIIELDFKYLKADISEISPLFDFKLNKLEDTYSLKDMTKNGKEIIISDSSNGSLLFAEGKIYRAIIDDEIKNKNLCCGCGDSMFAVYLMNRIKNEDTLTSFKYANSAGLACAKANLYRLATKETTEKYLEHVNVKEI